MENFTDNEIKAAALVMTTLLMVVAIAAYLTGDPSAATLGWMAGLVGGIMLAEGVVDIVGGLCQTDEV